MWAEAKDAYSNYVIDYTIAINKSIEDFPGSIDIAASLHPEKMGDWLDIRETREYSAPKLVVGHRDSKYINKVIDYKWPEMSYSGSSGLYAVKIALDYLKADRIILAGVPMTSAAHYYKKPGSLWGAHIDYWGAWNEVLPRIKDCVRSYSGKTRELLGSPDMDWCNG